MVVTISAFVLAGSIPTTFDNRDLKWFAPHPTSITVSDGEILSHIATPLYMY